MIRLLQRLFTSGDALVRLGRRGDSTAFARSFAETEVLVLSLPVSDSLDPSSLNPENFIALTEKAANAVSQDAPVTPFMYESKNGKVLPVFTSQERAEEFVKQYSKNANRVIPFMLATVLGRVIAGLLSNEFRVVINAGLGDQYALSGKDVEALRNMT